MAVGIRKMLESPSNSTAQAFLHICEIFWEKEYSLSTGVALWSGADRAGFLG
jgi:hypothetical protein